MGTRVTIPDELARAIDELVGKRQRAAFVTEAAEEWVRRERLRRALTEGAGVLKAEDYPHWATSKKVAQWVRNVRRGR